MNKNQAIERAENLKSKFNFLIKDIRDKEKQLEEIGKEIIDIFEKFNLSDEIEIHLEKPE